VVVFRDEGYTGTTLQRPGLQELLARLREFDALYCYRVDRVARPLRDRLMIMDACMEAGVAFHSVTEGVNLDTIMGRAMVQVMGVFAQVEIETLRERVRDTLQHRATVLHLHHGPPPYGYDLGTRGEPLQINPQEAQVVRDLYRRYAAGASLHDCARWLNETGAPLKHAAQHGWSHVVVGRLLSSPVYRGGIRWRGHSLPADHDPLVGAALWRRVQQRLAEPNRGGGGGRTSLATLLRCATCGSHMGVAGGDKDAMYLCRDRYNQPHAQRHPTTGATVRKVDAALWAYAEWLLTSETLVVAIEREAERLRVEAAQETAGDLGKRLRELDHALAANLRAYQIGAVTEAILEEENRPLMAERVKLEGRLAKRKAPREVEQRLAWLRGQTTEKVLGRARTASATVQAQVLGRLFTHVDLGRNVLTFHHTAALEPYRMELPRYWGPKRKSGEFPLP
jgi:site-specific DNA recombinase